MQDISTCLHSTKNQSVFSSAEQNHLFTVFIQTQLHVSATRIKSRRKVKYRASVLTYSECSHLPARGSNPEPT